MVTLLVIPQNYKEGIRVPIVLAFARKCIRLQTLFCIQDEFPDYTTSLVILYLLYIKVAEILSCMEYTFP